MNLDKIVAIAVVVVLAIANRGKLTDAMKAIYNAQAVILHEARASSWGSPDLLFRK